MITKEKTDLGDLDLLDDDKIHAGCQKCYPLETMKHYDKYIAVCGKETYVHPSPPGVGPSDIPPNACEDCLRIFQENDACPKCGYRGLDE